MNKMDENKICEEVEMGQVNSNIELEYNNLPDTTLSVQHGHSSNLTDIESEENYDQLPVTNYECRDETSVKEIIDTDEIENNSFDFLPLPPSEWSGDLDASGLSDATELDYGDPEILVNRRKIPPPTDSVARENSECDLQYLYTIFKILAKRVGKVENNSININEKFSELSTQFEIDKLEIQNQNKENMETLQQNLMRATQITLQEVTKNVIEGVGIGLKNDLTQVKNEVGEMQSNVSNKLVKVDNNLKDMLCNLTHVENKNDNNFKEMHSNLVEVEVTHKNNMDKLFLQSQGIATEVISAVTKVEGQVQAVRQKVDAFGQEVEFMKDRLEKLEGQLGQDLLNQSDELALTRDKVDSLEKQLKESIMEWQKYNSGNNIAVRGLQNEVDTLKKSTEKLFRLHDECQDNISSLERALEANATQGNDLNNYLHQMDVKLDRVGVNIPEIVHNVMLQTLNTYGTQFDKNSYPKPPLPQEYPTQPLDASKPKTMALQPDSNNIPSIPSSPLLNNSFVTPPSLVRQPIPDPEHWGAVPRNRNSRSDHVIADIVKREQKPSFNGDNVSPPIFLQEVERFFELIQITEDRDRLQLFPTFLVTNPFEWWKLISYQVTTWDMAKDLFLGQYFNDYERQRYKAEWHHLDCKDYSNVEEFTLKGLKILNTIKTKDSEQKKCERITVKLPEPLRDYLLNKQFQSTQHYLSCIKEAMLLKNFNSSLYFRKQKGNSSASTGNSSHYHLNNGRNNNTSLQNNYDLNNTNNNSQSNNRSNGYYNNNNHTNNRNDYYNNNATISNMNPRYKGNPRNYIPNFKYTVNTGNGTGGSNLNSNLRSGYRSPPKSPPRTQNPGNPSNIRSNGTWNQINRGKSGTYYRNSKYNNGNQGNRGTERSGASPPRPRVNQVKWAATPPLPSSPNKAATSNPHSQDPTSPPLTRLYLSFPTHLLKTDGADLLSPQTPTSKYLHISGDYEEKGENQTEN